VKALVKEKIFLDKSKEGIEQAKISIDFGRAADKLDSLVDFAQQCESFVLE
jgi:anthranilate phosphoribosyltransferase